MQKEKIHFISIGGSAMHNLAIALSRKGYEVTGSDDQIFEPSRSRLAQEGLLPEKTGWQPERITPDIDAIILGMHARVDNPELQRAQKLHLPIYSYPEYLYKETQHKKRVVIAGSHGKTSTTSMILHVLQCLGHKFDYMVGAQIEGFDTMVGLNSDSEIAVFEGDEYLASPIDKRPKMHLYNPHIAVITGVSWDHINVFPTYEIYLRQFAEFINRICSGGTLFYCQDDAELGKIVDSHTHKITARPYSTHPHSLENNITYLTTQKGKVPLRIFGEHNLQNLQAAYLVCKELGIADDDFHTAISSFGGAGRRLQKLQENDNSVAFLDFAHSPSKLEATLKAVKQQYPERRLIACMELHTFSSLNKEFLQQYYDTMSAADVAFVYYDPQTIAHKKLENIEEAEVRKAFNFTQTNQKIFTNSATLWEEIARIKPENTNYLIMTSGNFSGVNIPNRIRKLYDKQQK